MALFLFADNSSLGRERSCGVILYIISASIKRREVLKLKTRRCCSVCLITPFEDLFVVEEWRRTRQDEFSTRWLKSYSSRHCQPPERRRTLHPFQTSTFLHKLRRGLISWQFVFKDAYVLLTSSSAPFRKITSKIVPRLGTGVDYMSFCSPDLTTFRSCKDADHPALNRVFTLLNVADVEARVK